MYLLKLLTLEVEPTTTDHLTETDDSATFVVRKMKKIITIVENFHENKVKFKFTKEGNYKRYNYTYSVDFFCHEVDEDYCQYLIDFLFDIMLIFLHKNGDEHYKIKSKIEEMICLSVFFKFNIDIDYKGYFFDKIYELGETIKQRKNFKLQLFRNWHPVDVCTLCGYNSDGNIQPKKVAVQPEQLVFGGRPQTIQILNFAKQEEPVADDKENLESQESCCETIEAIIDIKRIKGQHVLVYCVNGKRSRLEFKVEASEKLMNQIRSNGLKKVVFEVDMNLSGFDFFYVSDVCTDLLSGAVR